MRAPTRLLGFFPARIERRRYGITRPVLVGWTHPYAPLGVPLVDREAGEAVIAAWFDHLADDPQLPGVMLLPLHSDGRRIRRARSTRSWRAAAAANACFARHQRALLVPAGDRTTYLDDAVGRKKRKELRRQRKRLGGQRQRDVERHRRTVRGSPRALDDFLALEAGGWKGRAGTAARGDAEVAGFMTAAVTALAGEGKARIARLCAVNARSPPW